MNDKNNYTKLNKVKLIKGGSDYFELLIKLIKDSKSLIHIQSYIFSNDYTGSLIAEELKIAAARNVSIYLIVDGIASQSLPNSFVKSLKDSGINFKTFEPLFNSKHFYIGRRMHQKVIAIDNKYALVGGINIANRYNDLPEEKAWLDFAAFVEGEIVDSITNYCLSIWRGLPYKDNMVEVPDKSIFNNINLSERCDVRIRRNDWIWHKNEISNSYIEMLHHTKNKVTILCSYFIPGKVMRRLLSAASKRGVKIKVIITGRSDVSVAKYAERWLYDWLLRNNIELYEYQTNVLHGKIAVCDDEWVTIGSYNINNISAYASVEFNLDIRNDIFAKHVNETTEEIIKNNCINVTTVYHKKTKNIFKQFSRYLSYQFIRLTFKLFTFYFRRKN